jgi:hypothetical protein
LRAIITLLILVVAGWALVRYLESRHPQDLPWTPLDLAAPLGRATAWKLASLKDDPAWCRRLLTLDKVEFEPMIDKITAPGCGWSGAVRLTGPEWSPRDPIMSCPLAAAVTVWERQVVRPAARRRLATNFTTFEQFGTYNCRSIAGTHRASQHSTSNAVDIAGFRTVRGKPVTVLSDWTPGAPGTTPERSAFLRDVRQGACQLFGTTLSPEYNHAHRDHLHLDMANWSFCR